MHYTNKLTTTIIITDILQVGTKSRDYRQSGLNLRLDTSLSNNVHHHTKNIAKNQTFVSKC